MLINNKNSYALRSDQALRAQAQLLRKNATVAERILWKQINASKLGYRFRRQHSLHGYITDFYCYQLKLIIEVDGSSHQHRQLHDKNRDNVLSAFGYTTLRFTNDQIMTSIDGVILTISKFIKRKSPPPD